MPERAIFAALVPLIFVLAPILRGQGRPNLNRQAVAALATSSVIAAVLGVAGFIWLIPMIVLYVRFAYGEGAGAVAEFRRVAGPLHWMALVVVAFVFAAMCVISVVRVASGV